MNLLYIYSSNINPTHGGVQRVTKVLCDYFRTLGHNCYYLSSQPTNGGIKNQYVLPNTELLNEQNIYYPIIVEGTKNRCGCESGWIVQESD